MGFKVAPSILSADFARLGQDIQAVANAGADWIHVDVMDGHFVPNLTIGAPVVKALRPVTQLPLDVHLMIENPDKYLMDFVKAGSDYITIHVEASHDVARDLKFIRDQKVKCGLSLRPGTPFSKIEPFLPNLDLVLVMTVEPGFGGQGFMADQIEKINSLVRIRKEKNLNFLIEVDGGINPETAKQCVGADVLVSGNYIFKNDLKSAIASLKNAK